MRERFLFGYDPFVLPFTLGMVFIVLYLLIGSIRIILALDKQERILLFKSMNPRQLIITAKDVFVDCLLHVKIFKRNLLLGYMHFSIAFGWFMIILVGHLEVILYTPQRNGVLYYPVFFRYFVMETQQTLRGAFFFFLMDLFLLMILSGIALAIFKRFRSMALGMRRTTKLKLGDRFALYSLWAIFPLRLLAESFTANISGGSFLTKSINHLVHGFVTNPDNALPIWWSYSIALGVFLFALPFSRYMHIPTEIILIFLRNAGIKSTSYRNGYAESEIYSCSRCGICIDACPMGVNRGDIKFSSVYTIRLLRRRENPLEGAEKCLMCNKCVEVCPVGINSTRLKLLYRQSVNDSGQHNFSYLSTQKERDAYGKVLYYAGCMTHLTPVIYRSLFNILDKAELDYSFMDKDGSICCGRPLMLSGDMKGARELIENNQRLIKASGCKTLLLSCPICYKIFKEEYKLDGIEVIHHSVFINNLLKSGRIKVKKGTESYVYHDPCELGRGSGIYEQPRELLSKIGILRSSPEERGESVCCGGSLGSLTMSADKRKKITEHSLELLNTNNPDIVATACPLCMRTFSPINAMSETSDIAQIISRNLI
ncbi:MAG: (Fe-S)-binding protein [Rikenellaceae bacterium]|nr:(Fe-S)-binding protein [Rikenellaceae bacterium]